MNISGTGRTAVFAMVELDEVVEGVRGHLDPPGSTLNGFVFELKDNMRHANFW